MQRVTSFLPSWDKTKTKSKKGFDKTWQWADKLGAPINRLSNKIGSEAFWPTSLDKESDKAARILRSFCKDGFYVQEDRSLGNEDGPAANTKQRILKKIPPEVIQNAVGLAIFTTMRTGLWISGAGGSGVLIARQEDGSWSPPSGILLHTAGLGFLVGIDVYDCVLVINNRKALESFTKVRATLGGEISAVAGPVGTGGVLEHDGRYKQLNKPVFTYLKSRGFYAGVQVDGTIVIERTDENERFYGERIGVADILAGKAKHPPVHDYRMLAETLKAAEGRKDVDQSLMEELEDQPAPGDVNVENPTRAFEPSFGIPEPDDPDPFGVLALEKAGLEIREAGSKSRPLSTQFEYRPSPTSPIYTQFHRRSVGTDSLASRTKRTSFNSTKSRSSTDRATQTTEMGTQTEDDEDSHRGSRRGSPVLDVIHSSSMNIIREENSQSVTVREPEEIDYTKIDLGPYASLTRHNSDDDFNGSGTTANSNSRSLDSADINTKAHHESESEDDHSDFDEMEEPVVFEAASAQSAHVMAAASMVTAKGKIIHMPRRIPPALPPRSPMRRDRSSRGAESPDAGPINKDGFEDVDLNSTRPSSAKHVITDPSRTSRPTSLQRTLTESSNDFDSSVQGEATMEDLEKTKSTTNGIHLSDFENVSTPASLDDVEKKLEWQDRSDSQPEHETSTVNIEKSESSMHGEHVRGQGDASTPTSPELPAKKLELLEEIETDDKFHSLPATPLDESRKQAL